MGSVVICLAGFLPTQYAEADGISMPAWRPLSRNASQPQPMSVLSFQEVPCGRHVKRL